jgi:hypothetical protein
MVPRTDQLNLFVNFFRRPALQKTNVCGEKESGRSLESGLWMCKGDDELWWGFGFGWARKVGSSGDGRAFRRAIKATDWGLSYVTDTL